MPEAPELRLMKDYINHHVKNKEFYKAEKSSVSKVIFDESLVPEKFTIVAVNRGKELMLILTGSFEKKIVCTMGMSGNWFFSKIDDVKKHSHLMFHTTDDHVLCLVDPRRFAKWKYSDDWNPDRSPDPMQQRDQFYEHIQNNLHKKAFEKSIHELMMDQKYFNGVGNYLRAEILDRAEIDPFKSAREILKEDLHLLTDFTIQIMEESYKIGGGEFKTFINPNSNADEKGDAFVNWLQCYEKKKKIKDNTGRSFWYDSKWDNRCAFCEDFMEEEEWRTEDDEPCHERCQLAFDQHWSDREEDIDLMGF